VNATVSRLAIQLPEARRSRVRAALQAGLLPPPRLGVREWSDQRRRLPTKGASEPGPWRTSRTPFLAEIMDCLGPAHPAKRVVFVKSAQVGGTEVGLNWVGWYIDTQRAPILCVQPTLEMAERWSKQRLQAMIDVTPGLRSKVAPARSRDSGNTTLLKEWPGGLCIISGANSAAGLRSMPARAVFADEVDAWPLELEGEGDPVKLAEARTATFPRRKILLVSTPTIESLSRIWREWLASDQRRYQVPCPHCGERQVLRWDHLRWPEGRPEAALYHCEHCGAGIAEHHKTAMLAAGAWVPDAPGSGVPGFHINGLYSPVGLGLSWGELAAEWEGIRQDPTRQKTFTNIRLGECVADPNEKLELDELRGRADNYAPRTIPRGCLILTAGVDVQKDRWAVLLLGHGRDGAQWVIDWVEIPGDPTRRDEWGKVDAYLTEPLVNACGQSLRISCAAVDSGYLTEEVIHYTRERRHRGVIAIKGASIYGRQILGKPSRVDHNRRGRTLPGGAELWVIGSDTAKAAIFAKLAADRGRSAINRQVHFPVGLDESFYSQVTAEVWDPTKRRWVKVRPRNEALDAWCYALAASHYPTLRVHTYRESHWAKLEAVLEPVNGDLFAPASPAPSASLGAAADVPGAAKAAPGVRRPVPRPLIR